MQEFNLERLALVNSLRNAGQCYAAAGEVATPLRSHLQQLSKQWDDECAKLAAEWDVEPADPAAAQLDDARRCAKSGPQAIVDFSQREERRTREILEDMSEPAIAKDRRERLLAASKQASAALVMAALAAARAAGELETRSTDFQFSTRFTIGPFASAPAPVFRLWYGTNRKPLFKRGTIVGYGSEQSDQIHLGHCDVVIPQTHRIGSVGSKWWQRMVRGDDRLRLSEIAEVETDAYWASLRDRLSETAEPGDAIIFIHGYNVRFEDAAIRAAQIGADLSISGSAMAFFSWPSRGALLRYPADETSIDASEAQITQYLTDFASLSGARRVHIIAHSMGNRGLLRAINRMADTAGTRAGKPFGQIILAAPDVDSRLFRDLAAAYEAVAERTTLYVSAGDLAVRSSRLLHGADRIGFTPPIALVDGIDTVNVTGVDMTLLGHGYVGECRPVLTDMFDLLMRGSPPGERGMLRPREQDNRPYWEIAA